MTEIERIILENQSAMMATLAYLISDSKSEVMRVGLHASLMSLGNRTCDYLEKDEWDKHMTK